MLHSQGAARPGAQRTTNLSSAEDITSSTVSPPAGSSNSAPEEFPVEPHKEESGKQVSSASLPGGANQIDSSSGASAQDLPAEPGEDAASPLKTKPLPKVSATAHEVRIVATGARAGNVSGERELFSESTTTVLVYEKGAVIRLTAAVTPGQLLYLSNEESKREVVTQVMRKRDHRPTECYVELEFTEPAPGFWGMEFSAATALLPKDAKVIAAAEMIASAETTDDELGEAAPRPSAEEVQALKKEVDALRSQLKLLQAQTEPGQTESGAIPSPPPVPTADKLTPRTDTPSYSTEKVQWAELTAPAFPAEREPKPSRVAPENPALAQKPALVFRKALPKRKRSFRARGQFTPGFRAGMLRLGLLSTILAALIATAWYKHWLPWAKESKKISVSSLNGVTTSVSVPGRQPPVPAEPPARTNPTTSAPVSVKGATQGAALSREAPVEATAANGNSTSSSLRTEVIKKPSARGEKMSPTSTARPSAVPALPTKAVDSAQASATNSTLVPPRLLKSERAVASLDDLRDFETGSVLIDAIIDTAGNVNFMNVLKGPPSLRGPALEALKNYKYVPAMQNGKPVAAHVTVKIQFRFE
jgi:TonB-like protein